MKRIRINSSILTLLAILLLTFSLLHTKSSSQQVNHITVSTGDTLWTLAQQYVDENERSYWIDSVMKLNFMTDSQIKEGQELVIPSDQKFNYLGEPTQLAGVDE
ncbi:LysM peptidoglycan-binding domain-containing protein [Chryseomicrobium palamuruense]|uniref:LysM peptidoglycan-binding domain-containing protein n=1 Tax=Chryseomicrobium palamuruense TaxID=682973 RepID=A0ABV8UUC1_9BACL